MHVPQLYTPVVYNGGAGTFLQHRSVVTLGNILSSPRKMASQSYNPQTDQRMCVEAYYVPHAALTNPDMDGVAIGVASES